MSRFQHLSTYSIAAKKLALLNVLAVSILLSGCTGDSLDGMTSNADGSTKLSAQNIELAKTQYGLDTLPTFYTVELKWDPPTSKSSGSPLSKNEIKEYRIVWFQKGGAKTSISVDNATTRIGIPVGSKGTYYFEITTVDLEDRESDPKLITASL